MEFLLKEKDYVPDGRGGLRTLTGEQEMLSRVFFRLQARRGALPFLPRTGSFLYLLGREKPSARQQMAQRYVLQALEDEDVEVTRVRLGEEDGGKLNVAVELLWKGQRLTAVTRI